MYNLHFKAECAHMFYIQYMEVVHAVRLIVVCGIQLNSHSVRITDLNRSYAVKDIDLTIVVLQLQTFVRFE